MSLIANYFWRNQKFDHPGTVTRESRQRFIFSLFLTNLMMPAPTVIHVGGKSQSIRELEYLKRFVR
jgi:hypothetical protein